MPFKTAMQYENGKLIHTQMPDSKEPAELIPILSITGSIDLLISQFVADYKITGVLYIEVKDRRETVNNVIIDYDISPKEAIPQVEQAIDLFYKNRQK